MPIPPVRVVATPLAELLPGEQRLAANTLVSTLTFAAMIAGPAIAGLLVTHVTSALVLGLDCPHARFTLPGYALDTSRDRIRTSARPKPNTKIRLIDSAGVHEPD